ncbi:uncharacterized protein [Centruroides vittatus]|uniref:uncharacterized protein n=1 Tax=Centruroides vittatus TaxID=120091 RepID=UPI003510A328
MVSSGTLCDRSWNAIGRPVVFVPVQFFTFDINKCFDKEDDGFIIGDTVIHSVSYADDVVIIAPTAAALRRKIQLVTAYFKRLKLNINPNKSIIMIFRNGTRLPRKKMSFHINNVELKLVNKIKFLGIILTPLLSFDRQIKATMVKANQLINGVIKLFAITNLKNIHVQLNLFNSIVYNAANYASPLWCLSNY